MAAAREPRAFATTSWATGERTVTSTRCWGGWPVTCDLQVEDALLDRAVVANFVEVRDVGFGSDRYA
eukprot:5886442-Prorocentrum_lima.AAC.1